MIATAIVADTSIWHGNVYYNDYVLGECKTYNFILNVNDECMYFSWIETKKNHGVWKPFKKTWNGQKTIKKINKSRRDTQKILPSKLSSKYDSWKFESDSKTMNNWNQQNFASYWQLNSND